MALHEVIRADLLPQRRTAVVSDREAFESSRGPWVDSVPVLWHEKTAMKDKSLSQKRPFPQ